MVKSILLAPIPKSPFPFPFYMRTSCLVLSLLLFLIAPNLWAQPDVEKKLQTAFILAEEGATIVLPAGKITLSNTLSLDEKKGVTIKGAGEGKTILSFLGQQQGAEGLRVTNAENIVLQDFTIEDSKGDLIKTLQVRHIIFRNITARWNGDPKKENGAYAIYPIQCTNVTIDHCTAIGASDSGIYVGQSDSVWVKNCTAQNNVAGIEIENTTHSWVFDNTAIDNTGGILVFDLPDLPKKEGGHCKVFHNQILHNNFQNFAPKGNIVGKVPAGTGVMVLAANNVEVYDNQILDNKTVSVAIVSYFVAETPIHDTLYNPYPRAISIHSNHFSKGKRMPSRKSQLGFLFWLKFGRRVPHIIYDGIQNPDYLAAAGTLQAAYQICVRNNENASFANVRLGEKRFLFKKPYRDSKPYDCD